MNKSINAKFSFRSFLFQIILIHGPAEVVTQVTRRKIPENSDLERTISIMEKWMLLLIDRSLVLYYIAGIIFLMVLSVSLPEKANNDFLSLLKCKLKVHH